MNIFAKIIKDSVSEDGIRLSTIEVCLPKVLLAEFNTHRKLSKNFSSARALPTKKVVQLGEFRPLFYGKNQAGMSAKNEDIDDVAAAEKIWNETIEFCKAQSIRLNELELHKQWANRLCDWFVMANGIVSSTEWQNFFNLRIHEDAQPEMRFLAEKVKEALDNSTPDLIGYGEWHLPYITPDERTKHSIDLLKKMSAARCCRVSYLKHDGIAPSMDDDLELFQKLAGSMPKHYSPLEHQATPDKLSNGEWGKPVYHGNFDGWCQFRRMDEYQQ